MSLEGPPPLAPREALAPGYRVIEHLSRGKALDVYDAWSADRGTRCIVKRLRPDRADERPLRRRLLIEGGLLCRLTHPHIVRGYEVIPEPTPVVVMETLSGETLAHLIDTSPRRLPMGEIAHLGLHLTAAIGYLHHVGWLHLDLKPSNVVADAGRAKVIDLSLARRPGRARGGRGTWCYMAPEQVTGGYLGPAADVWGIGVVLYEAITGQAAFDPPGPGDEPSRSDESSVDSRSDETSDDEPRPHRQIDGAPEPVRRLRRGVPAELVALVDACLEPRPEHRPPVAGVTSVLEALALR